jgi:hypothetical protein
MERKLHHHGSEFAVDVDGLVHPWRVFEGPSDVQNDADLSLNEKRAILASWASDGCAIEAAPALRKASSGRLVKFDEIMDALRTLDQQVQTPGRGPKVGQSPLAPRGHGNDRSHQGRPLH